MTQDSDIPGERIAKFLSRAGVASRREAERMIEAGRVAVNGAVIDSPALNVTDADRVEVDGAPVGTPEPPRLWLYHKPVGLVTTEKDEKGRRTVFDALPEELPRVMSVGRLDLNSEGLLLLTNDGGIKRRLELPTTGWVRKYRVRVHGTPKDEDFAPLRAGLVVEGESGSEKFQPMSVTLDRQQGANAWITVGLREGKNREIRRAMEAVGLTVNRLIRVAYGPFRLGELKPGEVEEVKARVLRDQLGLEIGDDTGTAKKKPVRRRKPGAFDGPGKPGRPAKPGQKPAGKGRATERATDRAADRTKARAAGPAGGGDPRDPGQKLGKTPGGRAGGKPGVKPGNRPGTGPGREGGRGPGRGAGQKPDGRSGGGPGKPGGRPKR